MEGEYEKIYLYRCGELWFYSQCGSGRPDSRLLPVDAHPMDIRDAVSENQIVTVNIAVERPWESWNVVDLLNLRDEATDVTLDLQRDLHLPTGAYLVYDF